MAARFSSPSADTRTSEGSNLQRRRELNGVIGPQLMLSGKKGGSIDHGPRDLDDKVLSSEIMIESGQGRRRVGRGD